MQIVTLDPFEEVLELGDFVPFVVDVAGALVLGPKWSFHPPTEPLFPSLFGVPSPFALVEEGVACPFLLFPGGENGEATI